METSGTLEIVELAIVSSNRAECIVRCLTGTVEVGDVAFAGSQQGRNEITLNLQVDGIIRYGHACDLLDPPHNALLHFTGVIPDEFGAIDRIALIRPGTSAPIDVPNS